MNGRQTLKHALIALIAFFVMGGGLFLAIQFADDVLRSPELYFETLTDPVDAALRLLYVAGALVSVLFGYVVYLLLASRIRTEQEAASMTRDLVLSREQFRRLYDDAPVPYIMVARDGVIGTPNKAMLRLMQATDEQLIGAPFQSLVHEEDQEQGEHYLALAQRAGAIDKEELRVVRTTGEVRWVLLSIFNITAPRQKGKTYLASLFDITEQKQLEQAKTEFVSLASHQLRTPLTAMKWHMDMILGGDVGTLNEKQQQYADKIYRNTQTMVDLVDTLLNVSRLETGRLEADIQDTNVIELAESVIEELSPTIQEKAIQLETRFDDGLRSFATDKKLLRMVIQNLMSNAVKYTPEGGRVSLRLIDDGRAKRIEVEDAGHGIPKEEQSRIFTKMFRATNAKRLDVKGTGLGLYLVKAIVELLGGSVDFVSEEDIGTTFTVVLY